MKISYNENQLLLSEIEVNNGDEIWIDGLLFACNCSEIPESYYIYDDYYEICGHVEVIYGKVRCLLFDEVGDLIYEQRLEDHQGAFYNHEERMLHLTAIANAIKQRIGK